MILLYFDFVETIDKIVIAGINFNICFIKKYR